MPYVIEESEKGQNAYPALIVKPSALKVLTSELAIRILKELSKQPSCVMDIARKLKEHEQKIYYHIRRLERAGIIKLIRKEERAGATAKIFSISHPFVSVKLFDSEPLTDVKMRVREIEFLKPFVDGGKLNAIIVVGSPDPHGRYGAQASDGYAGIDLALFLGSFLQSVKPNYKLDTQIKTEDLKNNLIFMGGPKANIWIDKINKKLPIYFDEKKEWAVISKFSGKTYSEDEVGIVIKMRSPFSKNKQILILSGKRFKGTRAATLALIKYAHKLNEGKKFSEGVARIVRGIDRDSDGIIDDVEFLE
jgi:DNA-binding transcriptional ArsR family regulator